MRVLIPADVSDDEGYHYHSSSSSSSENDDDGDDEPKRKRQRVEDLDRKPAAKIMTGARAAEQQEELRDPADDPAFDPLENEAPALDNAVVVSQPETASVAASNPTSEASNSLATQLQTVGLEIVPQAGDGNCLFRAISLQVYGDAIQHGDVRRACMDFVASDPDHFAPYVGEPIQQYIERKRHDGVHGNNTEIQALSELYNRPIHIYTAAGGTQPLNIFQQQNGTTDDPIRLSYDGEHYNAVVDPLRPTAGLGLGLPGLQPGYADTEQLSRAKQASDMEADQLALQEALRESKQMSANTTPWWNKVSLAEDMLICLWLLTLSLL